MKDTQNTDSLYEAIVFGPYKNIIEELTIELTQDQIDGYWEATRDSVRKEWYWKDIAQALRPEALEQYRAWKVYIKRSDFESDLRNFSWTNISIPPQEREISYCPSLLNDNEEDNASWVVEVRTQDAMGGTQCG